MNFSQRVKSLFKKKNQSDLELFLSQFDIFPSENELTTYQKAFTHKSVSSKNSNERLEFLGDSVLDLVISNYLFEKYPNKKEGILTQFRSKLVRRSFLDGLAKAIEIPKLLKDDIDHDKSNSSIYGNAFEALVGAIFLHKGYSFTEKLLINNILIKTGSLNKILNTTFDFKSKLLEKCAKKNQQIDIKTKETSPNSGIFESIVIQNEVIIAKAHAKSKKKAEQRACKLVLEKYNS